ncbi:hypothetical protein M0805_009243 [Coniferiporia weirii]|nr:hypothetical protein M0805_009243 [Coniferiporia weirii]
MPVRSESNVQVTEITATLYCSPLDIPGVVIETLRNDERSNILLSTLEKYRATGKATQADEFWIVCDTKYLGPNRSVKIDFVLSCTFGVIGKYPVFIYGTRVAGELSPEYLEPRVRKMVRVLHQVGLLRRVYSVFAVKEVTQSFARHWFEASSIGVIREAYYDATFSYCTSSTLAPPPQAPARGKYNTIARLGVEGDIDRVARLCYGFAADSPPFEMSEEQARREATKLIGARQLWVLEVQTRGSPIACIVALTRTDTSVTAVTKVYTPPEWRKNGFAFRLVREVCDCLLNVEHKRSVVLYVGHGNPAAHVYNRVGFVGLQQGTEHQFKHVENWLELGFDRAKVELGLW